MPSLADIPDLVGFFSYSREDDEGSGGRLSKLRERIQEELRGQLGRTKKDFRLWQDKVSISHGELWEDNIKKAVSESVFFIPIITPTAVKSRYCKFEFETFLAREKELGRSNLVFPILYIAVPALTGDGWREDPLLAIIGSRQYEQWQNLRHLDASSTEVALRIEKLCENISKALQQPWLSPQERQEAEARRVAEEERRRREKLQEEARRVAEDERHQQEKLLGEVRQQAEEERRRQEAEAKRRLEEAQVEKRRQDNERRKLEKEAAWAAKKARALRLLRGKASAGAAVVVLLLVSGIWLYRTTRPADVTSAVLQPDKQTMADAISLPPAPTKPGPDKPERLPTETASKPAESAEGTKARAKEETTNQVGVTLSAIQPDKQSGDPGPADAKSKIEASRDPALTMTPGSGQSFRDQLANGQPCPTCPELVVAPAGSFIMGSSVTEPSRDHTEGPQHKVTIPKPLAVGKFEITFSEWDACAEDGGCPNNRKPSDNGWGRGNRPVINVSWSDAQQYVTWLSKKTGKVYRLLSEAEWEYVSRANTATIYPWGNDIGKNRANCADCGSRWDKQSAPVGSFSPNAFGLYDTSGNVWEHVTDCWNDSYQSAPTDGSVWAKGDCTRRIIRGGSWFTSSQYLRPSRRDSDPAGYANSNVGFRVARSL
jgi:formylglycine-generating enzyme required for sulfatase activity